MDNAFKHFIESICTDKQLQKAILDGYSLIFEGINDVNHVFEHNKIISDIMYRFNTKASDLSSHIEINNIGFQYTQYDCMYNTDLNVRWMKYNPEIDVVPHYNPDNNYIIMSMHPSVGYDQSRISILKNIEATRSILIHELNHWLDTNKNKLTSTKYTRMSQIENPELIDELKNIHKAVEGLLGDEYEAKLYDLKYNSGKTQSEVEYANVQTELNSNLHEIIYNMIKNYLSNNGEIQSFDHLLAILDGQVNFDLLTTDSKKRLYKRLYVFFKALSSIKHTIAMTSDMLKAELFTYFTSDKGAMKPVHKSKLESLEYTHTDIMKNRNVSIFEANYIIDPEYKNWFDDKYCSNGYYIVSSLCESINKIQHKPPIISEPDIFGW